MTRQRNQKSCINCFSNETYIDKKGYEMWYTYAGSPLCKKCGLKLVYNKRRDWSTVIRFKKKCVFTGSIVKKGQCSKCGIKLGELYVNCRGQFAVCKRTHMHHKEYHEDDVLRDTIELCVSCHIHTHKELKNKENVT